MPLVVPPINVSGGRYLANRFYATWPGSVLTTGAMAAIDIIYFYPFMLYWPILVKTFLFRSHTGGAGSSVKSGLYANSQTSNKPVGAPLIADNTGQDTSGTGAISADVTDTTLGPGSYWFGTKTTGTAPVLTNMATINTQLTFFAGGTANVTIVNNYAFADTYSNAMPTLVEGATFTENANVAGIPVVWLGT